MVLYKGESIRNKGFNRDAGRYLARVISFEPVAFRERVDREALIKIALPLGSSRIIADEGQSLEAELARAIDDLISQGWRLSHADALADAERQVADRAAGRLKFG